MDNVLADGEPKKTMRGERVRSKQHWEAIFNESGLKIRD
jgi:hypothetical protein